MAVVEVVEVEPLRLHDTGDVFLLEWWACVLILHSKHTRMLNRSC